MMKTGVQLCSKDGGAHVLTHEKQHYRSNNSSNQKDFINHSNSDTHSAITSVLQVDNDFGEKFIVSTTLSSAEIQLQNEMDVKSFDLEMGENEESENVSNQALDWLKPSENSDVDMLALCSKDPAISLSMGLDSSSIGGHDLSTENLDYMFSKHNSDSSYFEGLDKGDFHTPMTNFSNSVNNSWSSPNSQLPKVINVCHLSTPVHNDEGIEAVTIGGEYVSFPDQDILEEPLSANNHSDLNSILFENIDKPDVSGDNTVHLANNASSYSKTEILTSSLPDSVLKSVPLTFSNSISASNLNEISTDLNFSCLPNFLGLENISGSSLSSDFNNEAVVNIYQGLAPSLNQPEIKAAASHSPVVQESSSSGNQGLNITTISISNEDKTATKILVDSHQGRQQMYVIKTEDLHQSNGSNINLHSGKGQQMYVISAANLNQSGNQFKTDFCPSPKTELQTSLNANSELQRTAFSSGISGLVLMPVGDTSSANVLHILPIPFTKDSSQRLAKKLLMCSEPGCRKTFKKASKLKVHQMLHTGERPFKCTLPGCEWAFTTSNKLKRHIESHEGRKDYVCDKPGCGLRFTTIYNLNTHRKLHERPCTEPCPESGCNQSFPTKRQLDIHLRNVHAFEDRTFKCPEPGCEKFFFSSGCMGSHMRIHQLKSEDLKCKFPGCGKEFKKICRLRQHEKLHTGEKPFVCEFQGCNWAFPTASKLKRHQTKHTGLRQWSCPMCRKQFHRSEHLRGHLITHTGDRPFICPVEDCGNTFTAKSSLYVHLKKHDESGKTIVYHCPMDKCERHYANKAGLRQHILVKHCNVPQAPDGQGSASNWLSLLGSGDQPSDAHFSQEAYPEAMTQGALTPGQDAMLTTDFLSGGMADQALLHSSTEHLSDQSGHMTHLIVGSNNCTSVNVLSVGELTGTVRQHYSDDQIEKRFLDTTDMLQNERLASEAVAVTVERGRKSQIMLENVLGSARTDPRSNDIISLRSLKRWQKEKEEAAAELKNKLEKDNKPAVPISIVSDNTGDYKNPVSNNVSLGGQQIVRPTFVSRPSGVKAEIPDMELQAEGIHSLVLDGGAISSDSFMSDFFIRDPETGITYRQTQLLQDDPPNSELLEDVDVVPSHNMVLDSNLDVHFVEDALNFNSLE